MIPLLAQSKPPKKFSKKSNKVYDPNFQILDQILVDQSAQNTYGHIFNRGQNLKGGLINPGAVIQSVFQNK